MTDLSDTETDSEATIFDPLGEEDDGYKSKDTDDNVIFIAP
jgi:hypothetical protein